VRKRGSEEARKRGSEKVRKQESKTVRECLLIYMSRGSEKIFLPWRGREKLFFITCFRDLYGTLNLFTLLFVYKHISFKYTIYKTNSRKGVSGGGCGGSCGVGCGSSGGISEGKSNVIFVLYTLTHVSFSNTSRFPATMTLQILQRYP
jgi:hypothetical protein